MVNHKMVNIERAEFPRDFQVVADLFLGYLNFLFERSPEERELITKKYNPDHVDIHIKEFAQIHARPKGDLLIARYQGDPIGCGMMREMEPGIVEIQRVFVSSQSRGLGAGKMLTLALMDQAREDGQETVRLDTGHALVEACGLYEKLGFEERSPYHQNTPYLDHLIKYYERPL